MEVDYPNTNQAAATEMARNSLEQLEAFRGGGGATWDSVQGFISTWIQIKEMDGRIKRIKETFPELGTSNLEVTSDEADRHDRAARWIESYLNQQE